MPTDKVSKSLEKKERGKERISLDESLKRILNEPESYSRETPSEGKVNVFEGDSLVGMKDPQEVIEYLNQRFIGDSYRNPNVNAIYSVEGQSYRQLVTISFRGSVPFTQIFRKDKPSKELARVSYYTNVHGN